MPSGTVPPVVLSPFLIFEIMQRLVGQVGSTALSVRRGTFSKLKGPNLPGHRLSISYRTQHYLLLKLEGLPMPAGNACTLHLHYSFVKIRTT